MAENPKIEMIASFYTYYGDSGDNRKHNVKVAVDKIDGVTLAPEDEFSFNDVVGARTEDNGFKTAYIIKDGEFVEGIGGGMMSALNLFTMVVQDDKGNTYSFKPSLMNTTANARVNLRPYGFTLHSVVSTASAGTVNITFSSPVSTNEKIYILVQPCNHNH